MRQKTSRLALLARSITSFILLTTYYLLHSTPASAHEAYVLTQAEFQKGIAINTPYAFLPLFDASHWQIFLIISVLVGLSFALVILWSTTPVAAWFDRYIRKASVVGPLIIRLAISSSFFFAAQSNSVLGPELSLSTIAGGAIVRLLLYIIALMVFLGVFVEVAAAIGIAIFIYLQLHYGLYMLTYLNYLGELLVLFFLGSRVLSFDVLFFGKKLWNKSFEKLKKYETPLIRIAYGLALIYAGYSVKFQHQELSIWVYNQYHLKDFFHASAAFIAAGAGLSEIAIGLFILVGFSMRWTILISLVFITLSLMYFHELIWPHVMLYGISFSLLINSADSFTIDHYMIPWVRGVLKNIIRK